MIKEFQATTLKATGASALKEIEVIQRLWSDYGKIVRYKLRGSDLKKVVVKHVHLVKQENQPRGWNSDLSHQRKLKSYQVEMDWYEKWSTRCNDTCRIPECYATDTKGEEILIVLEDLDEIGFNIRKTSVSTDEIKTCLKWLANFHATFLGKKPQDLWDTGTYWHLETRPEELRVLKDNSLKQAARDIDSLLENTKFPTFVHGDAKLANFCFSSNGNEVAAVDFQYVGGGCGMKDVAYFIGSCLNEKECELMENDLLDYYFSELKPAVATRHVGVNFNALEKDWRNLYLVAWADFHRFIKGWSPEHWKINSYSERVARQVVAQINAS